jgi:hypothetical protein
MSSRTAVLGTRGGYGSLWAVHTEAERAAYLACRFSLEHFGKYEILRELGRGAMGAVYQEHPLFTWMVSRYRPFARPAFATDFTCPRSALSVNVGFDAR